MSNEDQQLKNFLIPFLKKALNSYQSFLSEDIPMDAKGFTAYHTACKAVLTHIALLAKLTDTPICKADSPQPDLLEWVNRAKSAVELQEPADVDFD